MELCFHKLKILFSNSYTVVITRRHKFDGKHVHTASPSIRSRSIICLGKCCTACCSRQNNSDIYVTRLLHTIWNRKVITLTLLRAFEFLELPLLFQCVCDATLFRTHSSQRRQHSTTTDQNINRKSWKMSRKGEKLDFPFFQQIFCKLGNLLSKRNCQTQIIIIVIRNAEQGLRRFFVGGVRNTSMLGESGKTFARRNCMRGSPKWPNCSKIAAIGKFNKRWANQIRRFRKITEQCCWRNVGSECCQPKPTIITGLDTGWTAIHRNRNCWWRRCIFFEPSECATTRAVTTMPKQLSSFRLFIFPSMWINSAKQANSSFIWNETKLRR